MEGNDTGGSRAASRAQRKVQAGHTRPEQRPADLVRQIAVISAVCFALIAAAFGVGAFGGTNIRDVQGGALDADSTLLAPGRPAFSIWSVIYVGLIAYAIWQALPRRRANARQRAVGWWIAATVVLNGLWLLAAQYGPLWSTVLVIVALALALGWTLRRAVQTTETRSPWLDVVLVDGVTGLHLGWVSVATVANVTAWLAVVLPDPAPDGAEGIAVALLAVVAVLGLVISGVNGWRVAAPWAMAWGSAWIGVERLTGEPSSTLVGWSAVAAAGILFVVPLVRRLAVALGSRD